MTFVSGCGQRNTEEHKTDGTRRKISALDSTVTNNPNLFRFEFNILNISSENDRDTINNAIEKIEGVIGFETSFQKATCIVYADSLDRYKMVIAAIKKAGYKLNKIFSMGGPGLTCDISPTISSKDSSIIESLEQSLRSFKDMFNRYDNKVRIVSIPNPACLACVNGQRFINDLFINEFPSETNLIGFTAWISIDGWGTLKDVTKLTPEINDKRMFNYWDPLMKLGKLYKTPLHLNNNYLTAWDVYLIYKPGIIWKNDFPPSPTFWMHQLGDKESGAEINLFLDKTTFLKKLKEIIVNQED